MSRYPYTEACDAIRVVAGGTPIDGMDGAKSPHLSRADASEVRAYIASAIGMDDHELACKIADYARTQESKP